MVLLCLLFISGALAQEVPTDTAGAPPDTATIEPPKETTAERARRKLELFAASKKHAEELTDRSQRVKGEERELLRVEALRIIDDFQELSDDLIDIIPQLEDSDLAASVRTATEGYLQYQAQLYLRASQRASRQLSDLRRQRAKITPAQLVAFEGRVTEERGRLDLILRLLSETAGRLGELGVDASQIWTKVEDFTVERADNLSARLELSVSARDRVRKQVQSSERLGADEALADERAELQAQELRVDGVVASLDNNLSLLEKRGIDTSEHRKIIILATGEVTEDILNPKVLLGILKDMLDTVGEWIGDKGPTLLFRLVIVILFALGFRLGARLVWMLVRLITQPSKLLSNMIGRMLRPFATILGLLSGLWFIGVNPTTLLAGVGVAGIIIGLALQDSLGNIAAGVFILVYRPYDENDIVEAGGVLGRVREMGLANTTIVTFDNRRLFVPNRSIWSNVIENRSVETTRRVDTSVRISYQQDIENALAAIREILGNHELVLKQPEPTIFVSKLDDSWVEIAVWPWVAAENWWDLTIDLPKTLRVGLKERRIDIPLPRQEVALLPNEEKPKGTGGTPE